MQGIEGLGEKSIEALEKLLATPITLEFGGYGKRWGGRWTGKKGQGTATYIRKVEVSLGAVLGLLWVSGVWKPGGFLGGFLGHLLGDGGAGMEGLAKAIRAAVPQAQDLALQNAADALSKATGH